MRRVVVSDVLGFKHTRGMNIIDKDFNLFVFLYREWQIDHKTIVGHEQNVRVINMG